MSTYRGDCPNGTYVSETSIQEISWVYDPKSTKKEYKKQKERGEHPARMERQRARRAYDKKGISRKGKDISHNKMLSKGGSNKDGTRYSAPWINLHCLDFVLLAPPACLPACLSAFWLGSKLWGGEGGAWRHLGGLGRINHVYRIRVQGFLKSVCGGDSKVSFLKLLHGGCSSAAYPPAG